jgi:hypothetical protein
MPSRNKYTSELPGPGMIRRQANYCFIELIRVLTNWLCIFPEPCHRQGFGVLPHPVAFYMPSGDCFSPAKRAGFRNDTRLFDFVKAMSS